MTTYVLKFAFVHGNYVVDHYQGLKALSQAVIDSDINADAAAESLAFIEVWEDGKRVRVLERDEVFREAEQYRPPPPEYVPPVACVELRDHDGNWARHDVYRQVAGAEAGMKRLREVVGPDNVRTRRLTTRKDEA